MIVLPHLKPGGAERTAVELANYMAGQGDHVTILLMYREEIFFDVSPSVRIIQPESGRSPWGKYLNTLRVVLYLRSSLKAIQPDVIFSIGYMALTLMASLGLSAKVILSGRSSPDRVRFPESRVMNALYKTAHHLLRSRVNGIIAQTQLAASRYAKTYRCPVVVIPNFLRVLSETRPEKRDQIVTVGRCSKEKGQHFLLEAFARLRARGWRLVVVGDGPERGELQQLAEKLRIQERVFFAGFQKDVDAYLAESRIFAFTSLHEGYPNALLEAMATPLPCVSFDCVAGPSDLIRDGENGFLVRVGDVDQLAMRLQQLVDDGELRQSLASRAAERKQIHQIDRIAGQYRGFFTGILTKQK